MIIVRGILEEGLLYAIVSLGLYITYKILDFPDLTVDGTFPFGSAISAIMILNNVNPVLVLFISFFAGMIIGTITGIIHIKFKIRDLLSGIIVMTALYSINLNIAGRANLPIFNKENIFRNHFSMWIFPTLRPYTSLIILIFIVLICKLILDYYFTTKSGYLLRAVGDNGSLVTSLAKNKGNIKIIGLAIANGFVALAGAIYCQHKGFFEISSGTGTVVIALANVIIGTKLCQNNKYIKPTTAVIIGSIVYRAIISFVLLLGIPSNNLKLITSLLLLIILIVNKSKKGKVIS
ncbi:MAG: ABC transporter permease [Eubacteriales bacterium]|nr:ABC transporter permease [Eubacteriales bacterium]